MKKLKKIITSCKKLIDSPYNMLNLDNFLIKVSKAYNVPITLFSTDRNKPIKLMSGQHQNAGIISSNFSTKYKSNIYIVGKGILFDSGGYNLKDKMEGMKSDMAGMAIAFAVASYLKGNVIAYCPVATNFIHNNEIIPGDIIPIGKKKIEVTDTDAEGRLILADALSTLNVQPNDIVITVATLTGAVGEAIGSKATGVFTDNDKLALDYLEATKKAKEYAWRLPLWDYLQKNFKRSKIKNYQEKIKPGASMASMFVKQFIQYPENWIHLDIAYSSFDDEKSKATGAPIKSLIHFIKKLKRRG